MALPDLLLNGLAVPRWRAFGRIAAVLVERKQRVKPQATFAKTRQLATDCARKARLMDDPRATAVGKQWL
ncbi:hypothetical protein NYZ21_20550, partial [Acinetobacter baumannii]|nr:hypothetical protein [Acinetobacter baumannii]